MALIIFYGVYLVIVLIEAGPDRIKYAFSQRPKRTPAQLQSDETTRRIKEIQDDHLTALSNQRHGLE